MAELLVAVTAGDEDAFGTFVRASYPRAIQLAPRILRNFSLAEEVVQEAYFEAWASAHRFDPCVGGGYGWMLGIVRHRAIDRVRASEAGHRREERYVVGTAQRDYDCTSDQACDHLEADTLRMLVATLSSAERQIIELAYWSGLSRSHIAEVLGLPVGTVKSRVRGALIKLRAAMPLDPGPGDPLASPA